VSDREARRAEALRHAWQLVAAHALPSKAKVRLLHLLGLEASIAARRLKGCVRDAERAVAAPVDR
jgi:hypothetical protein